MMSLKEFRTKYPEYNDMSDQALVNALHAKYYSDMPLEDFSNKIGHAPTSALDAATDKAAGMMTLGLNHPFNAAMEAGIDYARGKGEYGKLYNKYIADENAISDAQSEEHPYASAAGSGMGFFGSLGAAPYKAGKAAVQTLPAWQRLLASARNNALVGAGISEANAVANSPGSMEDKVAAAYPAGMRGAAVGAALPVVAHGIGMGGSKLVDYFRTSEGDAALQKIAKAFGRDNITPEQAAEILQHASPEASLADVGGANVDKAGQVIASTPGSGANYQANQLFGRQMTSGQRMQNLVKGSFGTNEEFNATLANLEKQQQTTATPLYKAANDANKSMASNELNRIVSTPAGAAALKDASTRMLNRRTWMGVPDEDLAEQAKLVGSYQPGGISKGLKLSAWDYVKKSLDAQSSAAYRAGDNDAGAAAAGLARDLRGELDRLDATNKVNPLTKEIVPGTGLYSQARGAWGGPERSKEALDMGRSFMADDSQVTEQALKDMTPADRDYFRIGAARAAGDKAGTNPGAFLTQITGPNRNQVFLGKLKAALPSEEDYFNFLTGAQNEANLRATKINQLGNSNTAGKLAAMGEDDSIFSGVNPGNIMEAVTGHPAGLGTQVATNWLKKITAPPQGVSDEMAKMLYDPSQTNNVIQAWKALPAPVPFSISPQANMLGLQGAYLTSPYAGYSGQ